MRNGVTSGTWRRNRGAGTPFLSLPSVMLQWEPPAAGSQREMAEPAPPADPQCSSVSKKSTYVDISHQESGVSCYWRQLSGAGTGSCPLPCGRLSGSRCRGGVGVQEHARGLCTPASVLEARHGLEAPGGLRGPGSLALCLAVSGGLRVGTWVLPAVRSLQRQGLGSPEEKDPRHSRQQAHEQGVLTPLAVPGPPPSPSSRGHTEKDVSEVSPVRGTRCQGGPGPG